MSQILAIVILAGVGCVSPVEQQARATVVHQVPCAVIIRTPVANPFKVVQQRNEVSMPPVKTVARKPARCNGGKVIWLKKKNGKRRYRCA
jgi:hypothetical protein